jgi:carbonic anhydrase
MHARRSMGAAPLLAALALQALFGAGCASTKAAPASPAAQAATPAPAPPPVPALTKEAQAAITPAAALERLKAGNARFVAGSALPRDPLARVKATAGGQYPFASVLGCIDSRTAPELVFDEGIGDIFSARIAGNFVEPAILGSLEFASAIAGSKLILVLGHTECGAIKGACDDAKLGNLTKTLSYLRPAVLAVKDVPGERNSKNKEFVNAVAHMNVKLTMEAIRKQSPVLDALIARGEVGLAGGVYDVKTGIVEFME